MFDELKNEWKHQASDSLPNINEMMVLIANEIRKMRKKLLVDVVALSFVLSTVTVISTLISFESIWTYVALILVGLCITGAVTFLLYFHSQMPKDNAASNQSKLYVQQWLDYNQKRKNYTKPFMLIYFIALFFGLAIYLFELTSDNNTLRIVAYFSVGAWGLFVWFFMKPKLERQTDERINDIIEKYEQVARQIE